MDDVFGGLPGGPGDPSRRPANLAGLDTVLDGAALLGGELDTKFRVLAVTFEPTPQRYPWESAEDRRVQVLVFPVSTILVSLRREVDGGRELLSFTDDQLADVMGAVAGARVSSPLFGLAEPRPGQWGPRYSTEGRSTAPDGVTNTITIGVRDGELTLDLFARFDDVEVKDPAGRKLEVFG